MRIHVLYSRVNPVQAKLNCARLFREKKHIRDPGLVDHYVYKGYDALSEAEQHYCQNTHLYQFFTPKVTLFIYQYLFFHLKFFLKRIKLQEIEVILI